MHARQRFHEPQVCIECKRTMVTGYAWEHGARRGCETFYTKAQGRCYACQTRLDRAAKRTAPRKATGWPKGQPRPTPEEIEDIIAEYDMIRDDVSHIRDAARRLGISYARLDKILYRARARGDARAKPPLEQFERAIDAGRPYRQIGWAA